MPRRDREIAVGLDVRGRHADRAAALGAVHDDAVDVPAPAEHALGGGEVAGAQVRADPRRARDLAVDLDRRNDVDLDARRGCRARAARRSCRCGPRRT